MSRKTRVLASITAGLLCAVTMGAASSIALPAAGEVAPLPANQAVDAQPTAFSAGSKLVGALSNAWGQFPTSEPITVWTEALVDGAWSRSQTRTTDAGGNYVIPLTYGAATPGIHTFRVRGEYPDGSTAASEPFTLQRLGQPTAFNAGAKLVGATTYKWGQFDSNGPLTAWTEVIVDGKWSRSQTRVTDADGNYTIPLTYGAGQPGTYTFRVRGQYPDGTIAATRSLELQRLAEPVARSAGEKVVGAVSNAWGTFDVTEPITVWTEALVNGNWSRSQTRTTDSAGSFVIPLTYGINTPGTHTFRVRGQYPDGTIATSNTLTLERTGGTKYTWMQQAGIPESDWTYVDYIVSKESGWNPAARNPYSGACGLAQALPCSKVGGNWADPVTSLRWQHSYVKSRYGSYQGAYSFWLRNRWY